MHIYITISEAYRTQHRVLMMPHMSSVSRLNDLQIQLMYLLSEDIMPRTHIGTSMHDGRLWMIPKKAVISYIMNNSRI